MAKYRLVVTTASGKIYYGNFKELTPIQLEQSNDLYNKIKSMDLFSIEDENGDRVSFNPNHVETITLEKSRLQS